MPILKKRSYMLHKTLLVLTVYLVAYIFLQNYFLRFRKSGMQCWTFETSISLLVLLSMFRFFYCFNLLQQMFPAGIVEVIFCHVSKNDKKQKESPHSFFYECELSIFLTQKRASKLLRHSRLILLLTTSSYHIFIQKSILFIKK